jgi:hypothetical protein
MGQTAASQDPCCKDPLGINRKGSIAHWWACTAVPHGSTGEQGLLCTALCTLRSRSCCQMWLPQPQWLTPVSHCLHIKWYLCKLQPHPQLSVEVTLSLSRAWEPCHFCNVLWRTLSCPLGRLLAKADTQWEEMEAVLSSLCPQAEMPQCKIEVTLPDLLDQWKWWPSSLWGRPASELL